MEGKALTCCCCCCCRCCRCCCCCCLPQAAPEPKPLPLHVQVAAREVMTGVSAGVHMLICHDGLTCP